MTIHENGIVIPYSTSLQDIENGRNADYEDFKYGCQINADTGKDEIAKKIMMVAINWNCTLKFKGFNLPVVVKIYRHDHFMQFDDKKKDFTEVAGAVRNSFYKMKQQWQHDAKGSAIADAIQDANEAVMAQIANDIVAKAEYYGFYD